jgi:hypothetical protein
MPGAVDGKPARGVTRRTFLMVGAGLTALGAGAVLVVGRIGWWRIRTNLDRMERLEGFGRTPADRLRRHYAWLAMDPAAIDSFLADYRRVFGPIDRFSRPRPDFYTAFLLSTNFFTAQARVARGEPVTYAVFYEPAASPCYNPLAQPPPSDEELHLAKATR